MRRVKRSNIRGYFIFVLNNNNIAYTNNRYIQIGCNQLVPQFIWRILTFHNQKLNKCAKWGIEKSTCVYTTNNTHFHFCCWRACLLRSTDNRIHQWTKHSKKERKISPKKKLFLNLIHILIVLIQPFLELYHNANVTCWEEFNSTELVNNNETNQIGQSVNGICYLHCLASKLGLVSGKVYIIQLFPSLKNKFLFLFISLRSMETDGTDLLLKNYWIWPLWKVIKQSFNKIWAEMDHFSSH